MKCKKCSTVYFIKSCTVNENGLHHSYNDKPSLNYIHYNAKNVYKNIWHKNGKRHRENGPAMIMHGHSYGFFINDNKMFILETINKEKNGSIKINEKENGLGKNWYDLYGNLIIPKYENKVAIVLYQCVQPYHDIYYCLIDNEKLFVKTI